MSAVVPRFFQEAPFDSMKPSFLYLLALFTKVSFAESSNFQIPDNYRMDPIVHHSAKSKRITETKTNAFSEFEFKCLKLITPALRFFSS